MTMCGTPLGGAISGPIVGLIAIHWGWKASFVLIMIIGLIWTWFWMKFMKDKPDDSRSLSPEKETHPKKDTGIPLSFYLKQPTVLFTAFAFFSYNYIYSFLNVVSELFNVSPGAEHTRYERCNDDTVGCRISRSRAWGIYIGLSVQADGQTDVFEKSRACVLPFGCGGMHWVCRACHDCVWSCCPCRTIGFLFLYLTGITYWAIIQDIVHPDRVGGVSGFMHFLANTSGIIGPTVTGYIVEYTGAFTSAFLLAGGLAVAGSICVALFVKPIRSEKLPQSVAEGGQGHPL